jgi:hypothetical protein
MLNVVYPLAVRGTQPDLGPAPLANSGVTGRGTDWGAESNVDETVRSQAGEWQTDSGIE